MSTGVESIKSANKAFAAERKKPRPLKSDVPGGCAAWNRGADFVSTAIRQEKMAHEFDGKKYEKASAHQKEWGTKLIAELNLKGNEKVLDLGCGDRYNTLQKLDSCLRCKMSIS